MRADLFDYVLPPERIAQFPLAEREQAKLLCLNRQQGDWKDRRIIDLPILLEPGDLLVFNNSKVFNARLQARKEHDATPFEVFLLHPEGTEWAALIRGLRKIDLEEIIFFADGSTAILKKKEPDGVAWLDFQRPVEDVFKLCENHGSIPTPPYVKTNITSEKEYQTVYADPRGSVAAPTAGFHFTPTLLQELSVRGIKQAFLTLHVGLGTFRPMQSETLEEHQMHAEWVQISKETVALIEATKKAGHRVIAVGTTTTRALESAARVTGKLKPFEGFTDIFITPGYTFRVIDGLLTNFHLPKSTLIVLVSAFAGREQTLAAYHHAIAENYRFYSFGDAMLIL
jgi:S-adenosylmethionine:tRNA ribosyltransferase-isomerase